VLLGAIELDFRLPHCELPTQAAIVKNWYSCEKLVPDGYGGEGGGEVTSTGLGLCNRRGVWAGGGRGGAGGVRGDLWRCLLRRGRLIASRGRLYGGSVTVRGQDAGRWPGPASFARWSGSIHSLRQCQWERAPCQTCLQARSAALDRTSDT